MLSNQPKTSDDSSGQDTPKPTQTKEVIKSKSDDSVTSNKPAKVPGSVSTDTANVLRFDKQNNKLSDKLSQVPDDLAEIVAVWSDLPEYIKQAIKALIRTRERNGE